MEEARRVLERLDRIEELHLSGAPVSVLLDELRMLVGEAERWLAAEPAGTEAANALERCRQALACTAEVGADRQFRDRGSVPSATRSSSRPPPTPTDPSRFGD